ncbi:MAG: hypothetical protein JO267_04730 [Alphaproteobacteria bacterium]|nr:hypothetical protein [Alphaproteobacteria bacterium]MBV9861436.1 hypothetical protein [Alphaproteobacteria bacterium]
MQYRIEMSRRRRGIARLHLPGRRLDIEVVRTRDMAWQVAISDSLRPQAGLVELRAADASDAVWRTARAAIRALAELTGSPLAEELPHLPTGP